VPQGSIVPRIGEPFVLVLQVDAPADPDTSPAPSVTDVASAWAEGSALMYEPVQTDLEAGGLPRADAEGFRARASGVVRAEAAADGGECEPRGIPGRAAASGGGGGVVFGPVAFTAAEAVWMMVQAALPGGNVYVYSFQWGASQEQEPWPPLQQGPTLKLPTGPKVLGPTPHLRPCRLQ